MEYKLPKDFLCTWSTFFKDLFKEGGDSIVLPLEDGVVSLRSFQMLLQCMFTSNIVLHTEDDSVLLDSILEFVRLVDKCGILSVASKIADIIIKSISIEGYLPRHIKQASFLPKENPVRQIFVEAVFEDCVRSHDL